MSFDRQVEQLESKQADNDSEMEVWYLLHARWSKESGRLYARS